MKRRIRVKLMGRDEKECFEGWLIPGDMESRPSEDARGVWKYPKEAPTAHVGFFHNYPKRNHPRGREQRYDMKNNFVFSIENEPSLYYSSLGDHMYYNMGFVKRPKTNFGSHVHTVLNGLMAGYPLHRVLSFTWRHRDSTGYKREKYNG